MTKNFCDKCSEEVIDNRQVRISFFGRTEEVSFFAKSINFCEGCYSGINKIVENYILDKVPAEKVLV